MRYPWVKSFTLACAGLSSFSTQATPLITETDILKPQAGYLGVRLGARIESVETLGEQVKIKISLPKSLPENALEEVTVYGDREDVSHKIEVQQAKRFEFVHDHSLERSGLVIYLGKQQDFVLKLNYSEPNSLIEPDLINH